MKPIIIAIDGYSACGKSTIAKQLAQKLEYKFIDSGAMYRAITYFFITEGVDWNNKVSLNQNLKNIQLSFKHNFDTGFSDILLNNVNVSKEIRDPKTSSLVSQIAALADVRHFAVTQQQIMGVDKAIVMDGRDIGTTVFPNAELKLFITAALNVRVQRRYKELISQGVNISVDEVKQNLEMRDKIDETRSESPLRKAIDAILLDNTFLSKEDQLDLVFQWAIDAIYK